MTPSWPSPQPLRLLIDRAVWISRRGTGRIYLTVALPLAAVATVMGVVAVRATRGWIATSDPVQVLEQLPGLLLLLLLAPVAFAVNLAGYVVLGAGAVAAVTGQPVELRPALRTLLRPAIVGTLLLVVVCWVGALLFFLLPILIVGPLLSLVLPIMLIEESYGGGALRRSGNLVWYNPTGRLGASPLLKVLAVFLVYVLVSYSLSMLSQIPLQVTQQLLFWRAALGGEGAAAPEVIFSQLTWLQIPTAIAGSLLQTAATLYLWVCLAMLYLDLRVRREGLDLIAGLARLGGTPAPVER